MFFLPCSQSNKAAKSVVSYFLSRWRNFCIKAFFDLGEVPEVTRSNRPPDVGDPFMEFLFGTDSSGSDETVLMWGIFGHQPGHLDPDSSVVNKSFCMLSGNLPLFLE